MNLIRHISRKKLVGIFLLFWVGNISSAQQQSKLEVQLINDLPLIRFRPILKNDSSRFQPAFHNNLNRSHNFCGVTASFTPGVDSFFSDPQYIVFNNTSTNAQSIQWQINGLALGPSPNLGITINVGYYQVSLIATNGNCRDTFSIMVVCTGREPTDKRYFAGTYGIPGTYEKGRAITSTLDSGFLLAGSSTYQGGPAQFNNGLLIKLKKSGCVEWSKLLMFADIGNVIALKDSGYLVASATAGTINFLMRLDKYGNTIWTKKYNADPLYLGFKQLYEMDDGSLVATTSPFSTGFSVLKMDAQGNVLWNKYLQKFDYHTTLAIKDWQNELYIGGMFKMPDTSINHVGPFVSFITKMNPSNGQVIWSKVFEGASSRSVAIKDLQVYDTTLLFSAVNYYTLGGASTHPSLHWINKAGTVVNSIAVNQNNIALGFPTGARAGVLPGGNIMLFYKGYESIPLQPGFIVHTYFMKLKKDLSIHDNIHSAGFNTDVHNQLDFNGRAFGTLGHGFTQTLAYFHSSENLIFQKRDSSGVYNDCGYSDSTFIAQPFNLLDSNFTWAKDSVLPVVAAPFVVASNDVYPEMRSACPEYIDSCAILKIRGPVSVCDLSDTYTYKAGRNGSCTQPIQWSFEGDLVVVNQTDTTATVKFNSMGSFKIFGFLNNACNPVKDSIIINAQSRSGNLFLGLDTSICTNNSIVLHAGPSFLSYQWQNGTTDSLLTVTAPGSYWVKVVDSCGNILRDTIVVSTAANVSLSIGPDRIKCNNDTLHISGPPGFLNYSWSNNYNISSITAQNVIVYPTVDTAYYLMAEKTPGCFGFDTIRVTVYHSPPIALGNDTSFCQNNSVVFDAGAGFIVYQWSNGLSAQQIVANSVGQYSVTATTLQGCKSSDTILVLNTWPLPSVKILGNNLICRDSFVTLTASVPGSVNFSWNTGSSSNTIDVADLGSYIVIATDNKGCIGKDTVIVSSYAERPSDFLVDTAICAYENIELKTTQTYSQYLWSTGVSTPSIRISNAGQYWLQVTDNNKCTGKDTVIVGIKDCLTGFYMPTGFTPNNDGKNDLCRPIIFGNVIKYQFTLYNRWGQKIFESTDLNSGWDGKLNGIALETGVFVWTCSYQLGGDKVRYEKGTVVLIR